MRLVYLSPVPWNSFAQRPHKFVQWFHDRTGEPVLWIEPYPTRFPKLQDVKRLRAAAASDEPQKVLIETPPWLTVVKTGGLPIEPIPGSAMINAPFWQSVFDAYERFCDKQRTCLAIGKPSLLALSLLNRRRHATSLYDAMDDFPAFYDGFSRVAFARRERLIAAKIEVIWASSTALKEHWARQHDNVHLVLNGLDLAAMPLPPVEQPANAAQGKVFGYVGTIASWFDWDWVITLAESRPDDEVRLIGPVFAPPARTLPVNVQMLPERNHAAALAAMLEFDVALIPFKKNTLTGSVDPIKYYEYRALALPTLSTDFGEMSFRADEPGVFISHDQSDVARLAELGLRHRRDPEIALTFAQNNAWEHRFDAARQFINMQ
ncbi:glycosyltransferase family 1 protein [Diaphorobacter sp. HDW4A]|uniref:glycosyltransferase family 1 protein n=1 Tax=Diaphorobacter sp. HDW4A TaxID=2714924 RepID=UPI001409A14C|nr:glycosyltransferase family 1 protein [Diaphorobacter sp. HDW4A]QIL79720.1 glycosyltransferase family 1 protein [Diaphorobacter sp. HDW4A]